MVSSPISNSYILFPALLVFVCFQYANTKGRHLQDLVMYAGCLSAYVCCSLRCGMVYVDPGELRWRPFVQTWLDSKFPAKISDATKVCVCVHFCEFHPKMSF